MKLLIILTFAGFILPPVISLIVWVLVGPKGGVQGGGGPLPTIQIDPLHEDLWAGPINDEPNKSLEEKLKFMEGGVFQTPTEIWN